MRSPADGRCFDAGQNGFPLTEAGNPERFVLFIPHDRFGPWGAIRGNYAAAVTHAVNAMRSVRHRLPAPLACGFGSFLICGFVGDACQFLIGGRFLVQRLRQQAFGL